MATPDTRQITESLDGQLCIGPTDLTAAFPHGGTAIGQVIDGAFRPGVRTEFLRAEEYGGQIVEGIYVGETAVLVCALTGWDDDALGTVWPYSATGSSGRKLMKQDVDTATARAGRKVPKVKLCFSPNDLDENPFVVLYNAVPILQEEMQLDLRLDREVVQLVAFYGIPNSSNLVYAVGGRGDITL